MTAQTIERAVRALWIGRCIVQVNEAKEDPVTGITGFTLVTVFEDVPCRISFGTVTTTAPEANAAGVAQTIKLILAPDVDIPPGSRVTVTQHGQTQDYECSGAPARYTYHQEIALLRWRGWA